MVEHDIEPRSRLLAKLVRQLIHDEAFETLGDLTDALKFRCARLLIRWTPEDITDAYRLVGSNTSLLKTGAATSGGVEPVPEGEIISRQTAADILAKLMTGQR